MSKLLGKLERLLFGATAEERVALVISIADQRADAAYQRLVDDLDAHEEEDERADRIACNLESLADIPADVLPDGDPARMALVWLISRGYETEAYWSGGHIYGTPVVWLQPLADVRPGKDGRVSIADWREHFRDLLAEMGLSAAAREAQVIA